MDLFIKDLIKAGIDNGVQRYKCRQCMKRQHREHYIRNSDKVKKKHIEYMLKDPKKYREMKKT